jgi:hypothetical protein
MSLSDRVTPRSEGTWRRPEGSEGQRKIEGSKIKKGKMLQQDREEYYYGK